MFEIIAAISILFIGAVVLKMIRRSNKHSTDSQVGRNDQSPPTEGGLVFEKLDRRFPNLNSNVLPQVEELISHDEFFHRMWAIRALGSIDDSKAVKMIADGIIDTAGFRDLDRYVAYRDAGRRANVPVIKELARRFSSFSAEMQSGVMLAFDEIGGDGGGAVCDVIADALKIADPEDRDRYYTSLGRLRCRSARPILLSHLEECQGKPVHGLVWALGRCGTPADADLVRPFLHGEHGVWVRYAAIDAVRHLAGKAAIRELMPIVASDPDHHARCLAIIRLGELSAVEAVPLLLRAVRVGDPDRESVALKGCYGVAYFIKDKSLTEVSLLALATLKADQCVGIIREMLNESRFSPFSYYLTKAAVIGGWTELVPDIIRSFEDSYESSSDDHKRAAHYARSLRKLTGESIGEDPVQWRTWLTESRNI